MAGMHFSSTMTQPYHPDDEEDDNNEEMIGLLARSEYAVDGADPQKRVKKKKRKRKCTDMKPLEVMHNAARHRFASKSSTVACRLGAAFVCVSIFTGVWIWSGRAVDKNTSILRWNALNLADVEDRCLDKSNNCICPNPLVPQDRIGHKTWQEGHDGNVREAMTARYVDLVLMGDSIIEGWRGLSLGQPVPEKKPNIKVFNSLFNQQKGGEINGLALGLAGDKTFNLLWRIQNGEVPADLQPSVWWIAIGTNDFGRALPHCSPDLVVMGIKRVVEEMRMLRPGSTIVVNSLLPRSEDDLAGRLVDLRNPNRVTVWQGIMDVNRQLRQYCTMLPNVHFFDATSVFLRKDVDVKGIDGMYIPDDLMYDYLHPTAKGYKNWGEEIVSEVLSIIEVTQSKTGRRPLPIHNLAQGT